MSLARSIPSPFTFWPLLVISDVLSWMRLETKSLCIVLCLLCSNLCTSHSYIIEEGICYLALCEEAYPSRLAFSYLENLHTDFSQQHGHEVYKAQRPYFFIEFGKYVARIP